MSAAPLKTLLAAIADGRIDPDRAVEELTKSGLLNLGFAEIDLGRRVRTGTPEIIYCPGKTDDQILEIVRAVRGTQPEECLVLSRLEADRVDLLAALTSEHSECDYRAPARLAVIGSVPDVPKDGPYVAVVTGGTSDLPVAEEAAAILEILGHRVVRAFDIGVAAIARLLKRLDLLNGADVIVGVAGMEGALPSVLAGLVSAPIVAVPTSVGYGANEGGKTAMHAMLCGCAPGAAVVNIDNGLGAGLFAHRLMTSANKRTEKADCFASAAAVQEGGLHASSP